MPGCVKRRGENSQGWGPSAAAVSAPHQPRSMELIPAAPDTLDTG